MRATVCLPTYNERENVERMVRALHELGVQRARDRRRLAGRHRRDRRPLAAELDGVVRPAPRAQGRARPRVPRRLPPRARRRRRADPRDGLRLLARPGRRAAPDRGGRRTPTSSSARATWRAAARGTGGSLRRFISRGGSLYAQVILGLPVRDLTGGFKCYRRAVLEALPLDEIHSKGYAFQIETTYRAVAQGLPRPRGPDHVRRPRRGRLEDEPVDRRRGGLEGAGAATRGAARAALAM